MISPEQLRSPSIRTVLQQREVGLWVLDEAHCVSKWGHDFRPDYRYVSRFIREFSGDSPAPVLCLTATAKPEVVRDIRDHFQTRLGVDLLLLDGGAVRTNLSFAVLPTQKATKLTDILSAIEANLPPEGASGAVVYCATRGATEKVAEFLIGQGLAADFFHAGLPSDRKRDVQEAFRTGQLRVIAATNAFGMGIDKPDIRLVVHGDIPGSLENYLQEAGRAGRDRGPANCVLLFSPEVIVLGGGNTAMDCCRSARRMGASDVKVVEDAAAKWRTDLGCNGAAPPAACGVQMKFVAQISRTQGKDKVFGQLISAFEMAAKTGNLVGANLSSAEDDTTSINNYKLHMRMIQFLREKYTATKKSPLHITLDAGELAPKFLTPAQQTALTFHVKEAVGIAGDERIGHGVDVLKETGSAVLLQEMKDKNVLVEICLSS